MVNFCSPSKIQLEQPRLVSKSLSFIHSPWNMASTAENSTEVTHKQGVKTQELSPTLSNEPNRDPRKFFSQARIADSDITGRNLKNVLKDPLGQSHRPILEKLGKQT